MRKSKFREGLVLSVIVMFIGASIISSTGKLDESNKATIGRAILYVGGSGPNNYTKIQDAVDNASDGDTVFVFNGVYIQNVKVTKPINLFGEDRNNTILNITDYSNTDFTDCIEIASKNVNISDFTITNGDTCAISFRTSGKNSKINNCTIVDNLIGIRLLCGKSIEILNCSIYHSRHWGIEISHSSDNVIKNCEIYDTWGVDEQLDGVGILIKQKCENILVQYCDIFDNKYYGVYIEKACSPCPGEEPTNISLIKCNIVNNIECGIYIKDLIGGMIKNCNITNNSYGIRIFSSSLNTTVYNNNFFNNSINAYDKSISSWFNVTENGNYWDNYTGNDTDGDGIGDAPYNISGGDNQDLYPLIYPSGWIGPDTVYVDDDYNETTPGWGYDHFDKIQYGINAVNESGTVYVYNGTYYENVEVNKDNLTLLGENKNNTIIDGGGSGDVIYVIADWTSVYNFTIRNSGGIPSAGIWLISNHNTICNNRIIDCLDDGIRLDDSSSSNVINENIIGNTSDGIGIEHLSNNNIISKNLIHNSTHAGTEDYGIGILHSCEYNIIRYNDILEFDWGIYFADESSNNNIYHNNLINNSQNGFDSCSNFWYNDTLQEGNYWSDYTGNDTDGDCIGDTPYNISGGDNQDLYPFMYPNGWINNPPYPPSDPLPPDGAKNVPIDMVICWTGGDPDPCDTVIYDVYFGTYIPPPCVLNNITFECYMPEQLEFYKEYYWQIIAWDNHGASTESPIWSFSTGPVPEPDLVCEGSLSWTNIVPGATVSDYITIENIGESWSFLDWEVSDYPSWGDWTFSPSSGTGLAPEDGEFNVGVDVIAPDEQNTEFTGTITVVNSENSSDYCTIDVTLATPKNKPFIHNFPLISWLIERFPLLQRLLSLMGTYFELPK